MNIYIMVDIEGISGIYAREQVTPSGGRFAEGRRYMTDDINVCVKACKDAGADKVYVRDCHGGSYTVLWNELTPEADYYICGLTETQRMEALDDCDALILLGYHAMAGTWGGTLEHSMSSSRVQNYWINDQLAGEVAIDAGIAGEHGIPVIMVSGDDKVCAEAKALLPWVKTAEVKKGITSFGAMLLPQQKAHKAIYDATFCAVREAADAKPFTFASPVTFRAELMERCQPPITFGKPFMKRLDGRTYEVTAPTLEEAYFLH